MDYLIVYAHPNPASFNAAIKNTVEETIKQKGKTFETVDLYKINFDPVLKPADFEAIMSGKVLDDVKQQQELITKAETLVFIHPIWWYSMPAILKGYIDRVFSYGFAYKEEGNEIKPLLTDKKVIIINTLGEPKELFEQTGMAESLRKTIGGIFEFCGMSVIHHKLFYAVPYVSDEERKSMLEEVKTLF
ncbi:MAG: NAD(P)H-dependent oxidoreductase [Sulfurihydrogenibium sp.]|uniref:NAD(P)H-dependent oxidoreductase n=1 Tax=Sulfurihydrogenibium sp. TaxID=2053621 RepID=UPI000CAEB681|nr:MAG: flavodoxin family protein [Sulfurihydrogenibium sp.]PMP77578.1 MAG: flavodoxin family protein [Sulfurihydrogenibium sp.]